MEDALRCGQLPEAWGELAQVVLVGQAGQAGEDVGHPASGNSSTVSTTGRSLKPSAGIGRFSGAGVHSGPCGFHRAVDCPALTLSCVDAIVV